MPHVTVKAWPGKSEEQKQTLADRITKDVMDVLGYGEESISVAFEEVSPGDWAAQLSARDPARSRQALQETGLQHVVRAALFPLSTCNRSTTPCAQP